MTAFGKQVGDTLAALQQAQLALECQLKESARTRAQRVVRFQSQKHDWPEEDLEEVLGALGLR